MRPKRIVVPLVLVVGGGVAAILWRSGGDDEAAPRNSGRGDEVVEAVWEKRTDRSPGVLPAKPIARPADQSYNEPFGFPSRDDWEETSPPSDPIGVFSNGWSLPQQPDRLEPVEPQRRPRLGPRRLLQLESRRLAPD